MKPTQKTLNQFINVHTGRLAAEKAKRSGLPVWKKLHNVTVREIAALAHMLDEEEGSLLVEILLFIESSRTEKQFL